VLREAQKEKGWEVSSIEASLERARANRAAVDTDTRSTIRTAAFAFGGHISRGLLNRARAAKGQYHAAVRKCGRLEIFARISKLPNAGDDWDELREIVYKMKMWADPADSHDYHSASMSAYRRDKLDAVKHFVQRYAGARIQKQLKEVLGK
jgi:hypothetical protein